MEEKLPIRKSGTTTVGLICSDGVVLAAEKRSTLGYMVASKEAEKILPIEDHIALTIAGYEGDCQALARLMRAELKLFSMETKRKISIKGAATLLANILHSGRWSFLPYMVQLILAGYGEKPAIFTLDALGSIEEEKKFFSTGSGSPIALGVLESDYKDGISAEEGGKLALKAVRAATERDIASGGKAIDVAVITKEGIRITRHELK
ncbi:MAG: archaeal proteasome endopeptidase complex subunit beta [Candidatus Aenigmarchaeota archaeon]|nr:archaeal proteasome endopeptidase complex subunit beta [Candidatus Aenigmarchaeota archaeon]